MFPVTITLQNTAQLNAVLAALGNETPVTALSADPADFPNTMVQGKTTVKKDKAETKKSAPPTSAPTQTVSDKPESSSKGSSASDSNEKSESTEKSTATYEDAKAAVLEVSKKKGRSAAEDLLSRFGAAKLPDVKPDRYADLVELAQHVLAGGEV